MEHFCQPFFRIYDTNDTYTDTDYYDDDGFSDYDSTVKMTDDGKATLPRITIRDIITAVIIMTIPKKNSLKYITTANLIITQPMIFIYTEY